MSPPTRSSSRCCCAISRNRSTVEEERTGLAASNSGRPASFTDQADPAARAHPRRRHRAVQQHGAGRQRLCRQDLSQAASPASIPRSRWGAFSPRSRALPTRRPCSAASNWSRATAGARSASSMPSSPNQGDAWTVTSAYLDRFVDEQRLLAASEHPGESEGQGPYLALHVADRTARRRNAHRARRPAATFADFAPEPTRPEDVQRWIDDMLARAERVFDALRQRRDTLREADRALTDQLLAAARRLPDRLKRAAAARYRRRSTSATTATSISARC